MTAPFLRALFAPRSVAVLGASPRPEALGGLVWRHLLAGGFQGELLPLNPKYQDLDDHPVHASVLHLPRPPDLAVIATPSRTVPGLVRELGRAGCRAAVVVGPRFEGPGGRKGRFYGELLQAARPHNLRLLGPGSLGLMVPALGLNASLAPRMAAPGGLALVAQSGAVAGAVLEWALARGVGLSHLVDVGRQADLEVDPLLDHLAADPQVRGVLLVLESVRHARAFLAAARALARDKPVVVARAGRGDERDAIYRAAFRRAGLLTVPTLEGLLTAAGALGLPLTEEGERVAVVTNGGGVGLFALETLARHGLTAAQPTKADRDRLGWLRPPRGLPGNPANLGLEADGERYRATLAVLLADPQVDAVLVVHCPSALADGDGVARGILAAAAGARRTLLVAWLGPQVPEPLTRGGLTVFDTPEQAIQALAARLRHRRRRQLALESPPALAPGREPDRERAARLIGSALAAGWHWLDDSGARMLLDAYGMEVGQGPAEVRLTVALDRRFGPVLRLTGPREGVELPPLNDPLARALLQRAGIDRPDDGLVRALVRVGQLVAERGEVKGLALELTASGALLRARVAVVAHPGPAGDRLAIHPYPRELEETLDLPDGRRLRLRPIRAEDGPWLREGFARLTPEEIRLRFHYPIRELSPTALARLTQIDYHREMALVLVEEGAAQPAILGSVRLALEPGGERAEFAIIVWKALAGLGLGALLLRRIIDYARSRGVGQVFGDVSRDNTAMLHLAEAMGFVRESVPGEPDQVRVVLELNP